MSGNTEKNVTNIFWTTKLTCGGLGERMGNHQQAKKRRKKHNRMINKIGWFPWKVSFFLNIFLRINFKLCLINYIKILEVINQLKS